MRAYQPIGHFLEKPVSKKVILDEKTPHCSRLVLFFFPPLFLADMENLSYLNLLIPPLG